jgi:hypothetical protein
VSKKKSKLPEKSARIPEIRQGKWDQVVRTYAESVEALSSESAKSHRFGMLLQQLFGEEPGFIEEYVEGIERYVKIKQKDRILRGRVDNLFGNLVIEFERDLRATRAEAEDQVRKYVSYVWSDEPPAQRRPYVGITTDGLRFGVYSPTLAHGSKAQLEPEDVDLRLVEEISLSDLAPAEVYFWLDRYFRRQEILPPTTEMIVSDFGVRSHAFHVAGQGLLSLWGTLKDRSDFAVVYQSWQKYLLIVYGSSVADEELFVRHTYLATLAKLMAWCRLAEATMADGGEVVSVIEGGFFKRQGIENFLEEDFFSWVARDEARDSGIETARMLFSLLQNYNLRELSEDVLKSLYQELVDPETRHDLGEYYTPDWLAHRIVRKLLNEKPEGTMLDPACGSGTFLYLAIQEKRERLGDSLETLKHIQDSVVGVDIHPLAVIVAKTNYILALGDLLKKRIGTAGKVTIPVYLADSIRLPEWRDKPTLWMQVPSYQVRLHDTDVYLPDQLISDPAAYDEAIEVAKEHASQTAGGHPTLEQFENYVRARQLVIADDRLIVEAVFHLSEALRQLVESRKDTIWAFILKNTYKPLFLKGAFDFVVGNPPWLAYRYADADYQRFLKPEIVEHYKLVSGGGKQISNLELGTLFLIRAADLYLSEGGTIAFVLPRAVFSADQHDALRRGQFTAMGIRFAEIWDLEGVVPLFNVPSCVLFSSKAQGDRVAYPVKGQVLNAKLPLRNAALGEAEKRLTAEDAEYRLSQVGKYSYWTTGDAVSIGSPSHYKDRFARGADIIPRPFWFVRVNASPVGFDPSLPPVESAHRARREAADAYRDVVLRGNVEQRFLYATLLSTDLLPFGALRYRLVVLPIEPATRGYRIVQLDDALGQGWVHLAAWLRAAEQGWRARRGQKAERAGLLDWLDYRHKLTVQNPAAAYRVVYPAGASYLCACVIPDRPVSFQVGDQQVHARGFVADTRLYYLETDAPQEAHYAAAVLNSPHLDMLIKPLQSRGQWGARDIHKKVLEYPIDEFDASRADHLALAGLGERSAEKVGGWLDSGGPGKVTSIGRLRSMVREMLKEELKEIDGLVEPMLRGH